MADKADNVTPAQRAQVGLIAAAIGKGWGWLLALGIVSIVLGMIGLGMTAMLTIVSVIFFGAMLLVGGVFQLFGAFRHAGWKSTFWHVLIALLYVVGGIILVGDPVGGSVALTLVVAAMLVASGIFRVVMAIQAKGAPGWLWLLFGAILSIVFGLMIFSSWPVSGLWVIGLFVAIELIINGWSCVIMALVGRRAAKGIGSTASPA
jgi:uncharacterized membrane protein HdeD (DUF308 family)